MPKLIFSGCGPFRPSERGALAQGSNSAEVGDTLRCNLGCRRRCAKFSACAAQCPSLGNPN
eukprot:15450735-Alexandrium_andersonii.AAC.1